MNAKVLITMRVFAILVLLLSVVPFVMSFFELLKSLLDLGSWDNPTLAIADDFAFFSNTATVVSLAILVLLGCSLVKIKDKRTQTDG